MWLCAASTPGVVKWKEWGWASDQLPSRLGELMTGGGRLAKGHQLVRAEVLSVLEPACPSRHHFLAE